MTRSGLDTRTSRPPACTIVASALAMWTWFYGIARRPARPARMSAMIRAMQTVGVATGGWDEPRSAAIARRAKTITPRVIGLVLVTALFPVLLVLALAVDAVRAVRRRVPAVTTRLLCFLWVYLAAEIAG